MSEADYDADNGEFYSGIQTYIHDWFFSEEGKEQYRAFLDLYPRVSETSLVKTIAYLVTLKAPSLVPGFTKTFKTRMNQFYKCMYRYSLKALTSALNSEICFLLQIFLEAGDFENMLVEDSTLRRDPTTYRHAASYLLDKIHCINSQS